MALFNEEVAELSLTPVQYSALHTICKQPGIDQKTLAQIIGYDAATIGGVIDRLEAHGLVLRTVTPQDRLLEPLSSSERKELMRLMSVLIETNAEHSSTPSRD